MKTCSAWRLACANAVEDGSMSITPVMCTGPLVKRFARNVQGRDFVIGDVHGAYDSVVAGLRTAKFHPDLDRLFVLGDLVDRGPQSERVLAFLQQPYVHAILGNHERDLISLKLEEIRILAEVNFNGMGWTKTVPDEKLAAILVALAQLPLVMEIDTERGSVGLVHADVPFGLNWQDFVARIESRDELVINEALEGRDRVQTRNKKGVLGIDRVFTGHTIQWNGPRQLGNVFVIDTGAIFRELGKEQGALTMVDLTCKTGLLIEPADADLPINLVEADQEEGDLEAFGRYAHPAER